MYVQEWNTPLMFKAGKTLLKKVYHHFQSLTERGLDKRDINGSRNSPTHWLFDNNNVNILNNGQ